ncbi:MAG TPA: hypothetical protein VFM40_06300 [Actinomycetota bacterium]|nr:hypothetical protein [Actinomycetota bacterium]
MNDLEHDLREVLHEDARRVPAPGVAPEGLSRSVRRRQAVFVGLVGLAGAAVIAGIVAGATSLLSLQTGPEPAAQGPTTTGTLNGITITYPEGWSLIDPDTVGLNGSPTMGESPLPRIVLALAPTDPGATFGCPGMAGGAANFLMTVQEEPLEPDGASSQPWPVQLRPTTVDASESACYPGWDFLRAGWTAAGRTFEARVGIAPAATTDERDALDAAFASMSFAASGRGVSAAVLGTGIAGGEPWTLSAQRTAAGLSLTLEAESLGAGTSFVSPATSKLSPASTVLGRGSDQQLVAFGAIPVDVIRIEATTADGSVVSGEVFDVPDELDPDSNSFALVVAPGPVELLGYDASGEVAAHGTVEAAEPAPFPAASLQDGRHFGYVRAVDVDADTIEFDLAYFLSGQEANDAYHAAGGTGPVPNDYFVVNDNPKLRTLVLAPDVRLRLLDWNHCCETFFEGDLALFAQAIEQQADVTDGDLIYRGQSQWWVTVENGVVTEIEEQYSP